MRITVILRTSGVAVGLLLAGARLSAGETMRSYTFDFWGNPVAAPQPYELAGAVDGEGLGVGSFDAPSDVCVGPDGSIYVSDTGHNRVVRIASDLTTAKAFGTFEHNGAPDTFHSPSGLFVSSSGELYVTDKDAGRVLRFGPDGRLLQEFGKPAADAEGTIPADFIFKPLRIAASPIGSLYVVAEGVYDGLMEYDASSGRFVGFIGASRVTPNPLDLLWRRLATRAQRNRISLFLPTEYSSLHLDDRGFIYVTEKNQMKLLNPAGQDIFVSKAFFPPLGDVPVADQAVEKPSRFVDIAARGAGMFSVLDIERGRIFTYDGVGDLLYEFGGIGLTRTLFQSPVALAAKGDDLLVLDRRLNQVLDFRPLPYAISIHAAVRSYESGRYDEAAAQWRKVLASNVNYDLAYTGIARSLLQKGQFSQAMVDFQLGNNRKGFSEAFQQFRKERLSQRFSVLVMALALLAAALFAFFRFKPVRGLLTFAGLIPRNGGTIPWKGRALLSLSDTLQGILYAGHVNYHPYDGFWDIKYERRGNLPAALALLLAFCLAYVYSQQYTAFLFNSRNQRQINIIVELLSILAPFSLWCIVNWALSILLDGKGTFREIVIATSYSLTPLTVSLLLFTIASRFLILEGSAFLFLLLSLGILWSAYLLFSGMLTIHEYTVARTLASLLLTIVGIGVVIFIGLLFFSVINLMIGFVSSVYEELILRF